MRRARAGCELLWPWLALNPRHQTPFPRCSGQSVQKDMAGLFSGDARLLWGGKWEMTGITRLPKGLHGFQHHSPHDDRNPPCTPFAQHKTSPLRLSCYTAGVISHLLPFIHLQGRNFAWLFPKRKPVTLPAPPPRQRGCSMPCGAASAAAVHPEVPPECGNRARPQGGRQGGAAGSRARRQREAPRSRGFGSAAQSGLRTARLSPRLD